MAWLGNKKAKIQFEALWCPHKVVPKINWGGGFNFMVLVKMVSSTRSTGRKKVNVVLSERDLSVLLAINSHKSVTGTQLTAICFGDTTYETARKRLRRLNYSGYIGCVNAPLPEYKRRAEQRGRPENMYYLTRLGAKTLADKLGVDSSAVVYGPQPQYLRENVLRLVEFRLALMRAKSRGYITDFSWHAPQVYDLDRPDNSTKLEPDAILSLTYPGGEKVDIILELDTGNFRQTKHWEPKINSFLSYNLPMWILCFDRGRLGLMASWTKAVLDANELGPGRCVLAIYDEALDGDVFLARWFRCDGSITDLSPKQRNQIPT